MLIDAHTIAPGATLKADVCIIGAGAAGLTLSQELSEDGLTVIVLERGPRRVDRHANEANLVEVAGHPIGHSNRIRRFAVGGAGWLWARVSLELEPMDFEQHTWLDYSGWPFGFEEMQPFYTRARAKLRVPEDDEPRFKSLPIEGARSNDLTLKHVDFSPVRFGGPDTTDSSTVYSGAVLQELVADRSGRSIVRGEAMTLAGEPFSVESSVFVLAAGGIENPRLLLHSSIGNGHDLVGRFFADHPYLTIPIDLPAGSRPPEDIVRRGHARPSAALVTLSDRTRQAHHLLGSAAFFKPDRDPILWERSGVQAWLETAWALRHRDRPPDPVSVYAGAARGVPDLVRALADRRRNRDRLALRVAVEPAPNPESRVTLSSRSDEFGIPLPRVDWRLGDAEHRSLRQLLDRLTLAADRDGWGPLRIPGGEGWTDRVEGGAHHMGTTRMHEKPEQGVVDPDSRVHGVSNLYVAGSSVFPTYGYANPMLTIVALAIRLGDHLRAVLT